MSSGSGLAASQDAKRKETGGAQRLAETQDGGPTACTMMPVGAIGRPFVCNTVSKDPPVQSYESVACRVELAPIHACRMCCHLGSRGGSALEGERFERGKLS